MTTNLSLIFALCFLLGVLLMACGGSDNTATTNAGNTNATTNTSTASADKVGVPECDEYIAKVEACLAKAPAAGQPAVKSSLDTMRKTWKDAAATPQGKAGLAMGCKAALDQAKTSYSAYGCSW